VLRNEEEVKLEDCKPGVRVRVYHGEIQTVAVIAKIDDGLIWAESLEYSFTKYLHPKQLRRLVKRKRPEMKYAYNQNGAWINRVTTDAEIEQHKLRGNTVWLMRGVKKL
jgi:hypothetical protein